jgi:HD superfamily phosphohydrolase
MRKFKNYLLARMQMQRQVYMMQKNTACEKLTLETYLALANVPMWYYGFKPPLTP